MLASMSSGLAEPMDPWCLKKLNAARRAGRAAVLLTDLGDGRDRVICAGDPVAGELGLALARAFATGRPTVAEVAGRIFLLDVHLPGEDEPA